MIDIPIGLSNGPPRKCDEMARKGLGKPRGSSVFPTPVRPALYKYKTHKVAGIIEKM